MCPCLTVFPAVLKAAGMLEMLIGRLEIFPSCTFSAPAAYREATRMDFMSCSERGT